MAPQDAKQAARDKQKRSYYEENSFVFNPVQPGLLYGFNSEHGYMEAIVRGFRSGFLSDAEYRQMGQCLNLQDVKLCFNDTDYVGVLENTNKMAGVLTVELIDELCYEKFIDEFNFIKNQATGALAVFLNMIQYEYMIKNVMYLITGLVNGNDGKALLEKADKLGAFPQMASILTFDNTEAGFMDLFRTVLIDCPIGKLFEQYFVEKRFEEGGDGSIREIKAIMEESDVEIIQEQIVKYWLEAFYMYCEKLGGITWDHMKPMLDFRADKRAINIMLNSFDTHLGSVQGKEERQKLFCTFGELYPTAIEKFTDVTDEEDLRKILDQYKNFNKYCDEADMLAMDAGAEETWVDHLADVMLKEEILQNVLAFEEQGHLACFYSFVQLKMQEKRNIFWICECIAQNQREAVDKYIAPFSLRRTPGKRS